MLPIAVSIGDVRAAMGLWLGYGALGCEVAVAPRFRSQYGGLLRPHASQRGFVASRPVKSGGASAAKCTPLAPLAFAPTLLPILTLFGIGGADAAQACHRPRESRLARAIGPGPVGGPVEGCDVDKSLIAHEFERMARSERSPRFLGELEQVVLLAVLQAGQEAFAVAVLEELDRRAGRRLDRGALYKTLDRLEAKRFVRWTVEAATPERGGHRRRRFEVTSAGLRALRASQRALTHLWDGLDPILKNTSS